MQNLSTGSSRAGSAPVARSAASLPLERHHRLDDAAAAVVALVASRRQVPPQLLLHASRCCAGIAEARQLAMYLTHVVLRRTYAEVGTVFGRDRTTVSHACAHIEDLRDEPAFDTEVAGLEAAILRWSPESAAQPLRAYG